MKKFLIVLLVIALVIGGYVIVSRTKGECIGGFHFSFSEATCTKDKTCIICSAVMEKATGHIFKKDAADCDENVFCINCYYRRIPTGEHQWQDATCTSPQICLKCKKTGSPALGHNYVNGTCKRCKDITYGIWKEDYYVDKYGDKTKQDYVYAYATGTFSNSATTNSKLEVEWLFDIDGANLKLYEYGSSLIKGYLSSTEYYEVSAKNEKGKEIEITASLEKNSDRLAMRDEKKIYNILSSGGIVKFVIINKESRINKYSFSINADGFKNMWDKHWTWKK